MDNEDDFFGEIEDENEDFIHVENELQTAAGLSSKIGISAESCEK